MMGTSVIVCADRGTIAARALDLLADGLRAGLRLRGEAHLALTGGSSAAALFDLLRRDARADRVDWSRVHVWQGDERFVPVDHPDRNWAAALDGWLAADGGVGAPRHPVPVEAALAAGHDAEWAAARYAEEVAALLPRRRGVPAFDVVLLGMGEDGHILSAFPGSAALREREVPVLAVPAPTHITPHLPRVTLSPFLLPAAGTTIVMVPGAAKADTVAAVLGSPAPPLRLPAQLAVLPTAVWLLETASAARL